ncbi:MAG: hypothetical protein ACTSQN_16010 [Candidatus Heimdallarchaeota archaeon]
MWKQEEDEYNDFIDYQRRAKEDIKTRRFCPNCMQVVKMKLREYKHFQNHLYASGQNEASRVQAFPEPLLLSQLWRYYLSSYRSNISIE